MNCSANTLRQLYNLYLEHRRKDVVANRLNELGCRTKRGKDWNGIAVGRILDQTKWLDIEFDAQRRRKKPEISKELFDKVQALLRLQRKSKSSGKSPTHLFAGRVMCHCGSIMYKASNSPKYICRGCRNKIPADDLEKIFLSQLEPFTRHSKTFKLVVKQWDDLPFQTKFQIVDTILEDVVIQKDDNVELLFSFNPLSKDAGNSQHCEYPTNSERIIQAAETGEWDEDTVQAVHEEAAIAMGEDMASNADTIANAASTQLISAEEAAKMIGYSRKYLLRMADAWGLEKIKTSSKSVRFERAQVVRFAQNRKLSK